MNNIPKYTLLDNVAPNGLTALRIDEGEYKGTEYYYGKVTFDEPEDTKNEESVKLSFELNVTSAPNDLTPDDIENDTTFHKIAGDILVELILNSIDNTDAE